MPSPLSHTLVGIFIYRNAGKFLRKSWWTFFLTLLFVNISDIDFLWYRFLDIEHTSTVYLRRGFTHSIVFVFIIALIITSFLQREYKKSYGRLFVYFFFSMLTHIAMDFFQNDANTPYGIMLFWPFSKRFFIAPIRIFRQINHRTLADLFSLATLKNIAFNLFVTLAILIIIYFIFTKLFDKLTDTNNESAPWYL